MKVFVCNDFKGRWPVGTAAVVVAENVKDARRLLMKELESQGLPQDGEKFSLLELVIEEPIAVILNDGDY